MNAAEITDKLGLHSLRNRNWYIQVSAPLAAIALSLSLSLSPPYLFFSVPLCAGALIPPTKATALLLLLTSNQATCATNGEGLYEGLDWLSQQLKNAKH